VSAEVVGILSADETRDAAVRTPILANGSKIRKAAGKIFFLEVSFFLIAPNDVPLRISEEGVIFGTGIAIDASGESRALRRPRNWRMKLALKFASPAAESFESYKEQEDTKTEEKKFE